MLKLVDIKKDYVMKDQPTVHALKGVSINFRRNEFVAILGHSGCGKTTLLNIIGGLDRYTSGDLIIEGKSTKKYTDRDWDTYRNHSIGFVFQAYNLIGHINVLANVELALTISGISKSERTKRALEALAKVGLQGMEKKKPNQLSGGQMQRVAIARALVNNPEILLADEPTGALDSETSIQIMNLLQEVAKDRLVIMVTHNPDLASTYATRIVTIKDGLLIKDSKPYKGESAKQLEKAKENKSKIFKGKKKLASMSFFTALGLSWNNLKAKKGRTFLTAFAGSIGIIGIALILSVSYGFNQYIGKVQEDALTSYPMTVSKTSVSASSALASIMSSMTSEGTTAPEGTVGSDETITGLVQKLSNSINQNNTKGFKEYIEDPEVRSQYSEYLTGISYSYNTSFNLFTKFEGKAIQQTYPVDLSVTDYSCIEDLPEIYQNSIRKIFSSLGPTLESYFSDETFPTFSEMIPSIDPETSGKEYSQIIEDQYDVIYGRMPKETNEVVLIVDSNGNIDDYLLYSLGLKNPQNLIISMAKGLATSQNIPAEIVEKIKLLPEEYSFPMSYEQICSYQYYLPLSYEMFNPDENNTETSETLKYYIKTLSEMSTYLTNSSSNPEDENYVMELNITGIVKIKDGVTTGALSGAIGYLPSLGDYLVDKTANGPESGYYSKVENNVCLGQEKLKDSYDVISGEPFYIDVTSSKSDYSNKIFPTDSEVLEDFGLPQATILLIKGYGIIDYTNISHNSFTMKIGNNTYHDQYDETNDIGVLYAENSNIPCGGILYDSGLVYFYRLVFPETIDEKGSDVSYSFTYTYQSANTNARTYSRNCSYLGIADLDDPSKISIYPKDFESKEKVNELVSEFNKKMELDVRSHPEKYTDETNPSEATLKRLVAQQQVAVSDYVGLLMGSVQTIVNSVSYVLIAFVSISLIVSSIMIAIITYVSVLERKKEIGVLRSIGARKIDISNVFNAETLITGASAGILGVLISLLLDIPISIIINSLAHISLTIVVPIYGVVALPLISIALTMISGLVPSIMAAKKDPVIALRSE